jgi:PilZ domain-containing protein
MMEPRKRSDTRQLLRDRRTTLRFPCALQATCVLAGTEEGLPAHVSNISSKGAALVLSRPLPQGTVLTVELLRGSFHLTIAAQVVYVLSAVNGWCHGCQWQRLLSGAELDSLVS